MPETTEPIEVLLGKRLRAAGKTLAVAESCTGGLIGHRITEVPGSSDYFPGGVISYSDEAKRKFLGVREGTLAAHGAVSRETALEMARGVRLAFEADVGAAVTGIAGPTGGSAEKPVGLTWVAVSTEAGEWAERHVFRGNRQRNKLEAADAALALALRVLENA